MLRRVNLTILLGITTVAILSLGFSAGAAQEAEEQAAVEVPSEDEGAEDARGELERLQWEVQAAHGARLNADEKKQQIADDVADTQNELAKAEDHSSETKQELADTASEVYREGGFGDLLGILVGVDSLGGFGERLDLATRLLVKKQEAVKDAGQAKDKLATELEERRNQLGEWETTGAEEEDLEQQMLDAEANVQAYLDELPEEVRQDLETEREQQAELDQARGEEILKNLEEAESSDAMNQGLVEIPTEAERLAELRDVEQAAEIDVTEKALEAEQARLAAEQQPAVEQPAPEEAPAEEVQAGPGAEQVALEARQAEQAATQAAEQAKAAEKARQVAERQVAVERVMPQPTVKEAERQAAGKPPEVSNDTNGVVDAGDRLKVEGEFSIKPGATVTFEDADGTRGTAIDGLNAKILEGSIETEMLGPLENVTGGDGVLDTTGDLGVVDTTGITSPGVADAGLPYDPTLGPGPILGTAGSQDGPVIGAEPIIPELVPSGPAVLQYEPAIGATPILGPEPPILGAEGRPGGSRPGGILGEKKPNSPASGQPGLQPATGAAPRVGGGGGPASGSAIVREAMSWLGTPYSFGGTSRDGISCSGLVMMAYQKLGISLPNSPGGQLDAVGKLNPGSAPAGAIVFFTEDGSGTPTHVGISNGDGTMTDSNIVKGQVGITPIDIVTGYMGWGFPAGM